MGAIEFGVRTAQHDGNRAACLDIAIFF